MQINNVLIAPVLTEKATKLASTKIYMFYVEGKANKHQIGEAIKTLYGVKVGKLRVTNRAGKTRRIGKRMKTISLPDKKIAYVQVTEGKIGLFPQA